MALDRSTGSPRPRRSPPPPPAEAIDELVATAAAALGRATDEARRIVVGQERTIERLLVAWLARGHVLLEGPPGLAKSLAASTVATIVGGSFARIQFTPDLVPADIVGTRLYRPSSEEFDVELGPVFANVVLADEINRAPAKVQSALLEVMAERQVTIGGTSYEVPAPFLVLATQNPIEHEGVYPLPEAQRDRFLLKVVVGYPDPGEEAEIVRRMGVAPPVARRVLDDGEVARLQQVADAVVVHDAVLGYAVRLVLSTRRPEDHGMSELAGVVAHGASPRATLGLVAAGRALALLRGRGHVLPEDVHAVARDVLRHRVLLTFDALARGITATDVVDAVVTTVTAPRMRSGGLAAETVG